MYNVLLIVSSSQGFEFGIKIFSPGIVLHVLE